MRLSLLARQDNFLSWSRFLKSTLGHVEILVETVETNHDCRDSLSFVGIYPDILTFSRLFEIKSCFFQFRSHEKFVSHKNDHETDSFYTQLTNNLG